MFATLCGKKIFPLIGNICGWFSCIVSLEYSLNRRITGKLKMEKYTEIPEKKRKIEEIGCLEDGSPQILESFEGFDIEKVIAENNRNKTTTIHAKINGKDAVVLLEKTPFELSHVKNYLTENTTLRNTLKNDVYGTYEAYLPPTENVVKAVVIHPATEKHIQKYSYQERFIIRETPELYNQVTLPLLTSSKFSMQWVYNILEKKQEADRIVFEDSDPEIGFILLPDMKWDRKDINSLYLVGIVHKHGIKSLRDLNAASLPLLKNILTKGQEAIQEKFDIPPSKIHAYIHYQPSYYHFHVHFTHIKLEAPGFGADRGHLLTDVIDNIEMMSDYYSKRTLTYVVSEQQDLCIKFKEHGYFENE